MIQRLLNRLSLSRIFSILVLSLLLPSSAWGQTFSTGKFQVTGDQSPYTYKWLIGTDDSYYWETTLNNATCTGLDDNSQSVQISETAGSFNAPLTFNNPDNETATSVSFTLNESRLKSITSITINLGSISEGVSISAGGESFTSLITGTNTLSFSHPRLWDNGFYINISLPQSSSVKISSISITTGTYLGVTVDGIAVTSGVNEGDVLGDGKVSFTSVDGGTPATLTLNNVTLGAIISNLANEQLTIDLAGTNILNGFLSDESSSGTLKFTGSGSLEISNSDGTITGYTAVDFGNFNLKSNSPGINYGEISGTQGLYRLQDYNNDAVGNVTITKETVYPIWVYDDAGDYNRHFLQLTEENKGNVLGDDYSSVSYNSSNDSGTLTVKGAQISHMDYPSFVIGKDIAALTVHLVGYNEIGGSGNKAFLFLGNNTTLTFTTSETQSGYLQTYGTISQGHSGNISYKNGLELDTNSKVITVPESSNKQSTYITGNVSVINEQDGAFYLYTNSTAYYATNTSLKSRDNHAPTYVKVSSSTDGGTKEAGLWPSLTTEQTVQINKVTLQFDWGDCINKNVTVQVRGINEEGEPGNTTWTADGKIYSEAISLTNADGIVEIPLTTEVSSNYIQLYLTSSEEFSIVPLSVGLTNAAPYDLVVNNVPVTITNRDNVLNDGKVSFTPATETTSAKLTLNNGASVSKITSGLAALTIEIKGSSSVGYIETNTATEGDKTLTITKGSDNSSLALTAAQEHSVIEGFKSVSVGDGIYVKSNNPCVYNTSNKQYETTDATVLGALTFTTTPYYSLWVTRMQSSDPIIFQVNDENKSNILDIDNASVKFDGTNTLTFLEDEELYKYSCVFVTSGLDALTIAINGSCKLSSFNKGDNTPAITSVNPNAPLTIALSQGATSGDLALISNTGKAISGFKSLTHTGLLNLTDGASYNTGNLQWSASEAALASEIKKPTIEINYTNKYFSINNPNARGYGGSLMRKTVRMTNGGKVEDAEESVTEHNSQDYNNNIAIWKYWVKANGNVSDTIYACRLGLKDVEATYGDTSIPTPNILPEYIDGVSLSYSTEGYGTDVAEAVDGAISIKATGCQFIDATFSNIPAGYTFLTDEESGTPEASFSLMVKPQKPTLSLETGTYVGTQTVEVGNISPNATAKYYTYEGENAPANPEVLDVPENNKIEIASSKTLVVYSETEYELENNTGYLKSETESATYTISIDISDFRVLNKEATAAFGATATYTGSAIVPEFKVVDTESIPLTADTDYSVSYKKVGEGAALTDVTSMVDVGSYKIVITGTGNYGGSISKDFEITKGDADLMFYYIVDGEKNYPEVGNAVYGSYFDAPLLENPHNLLVTYSSKVSAEEGADDSDIATIDATTGTITIHKAGTAIIIAATQGNDNYSAGTALYELNVAKANLNTVTITEIENQTYTGSAIEPIVTVTLNGEEVSTNDYTVSYSNNTDVSTDTQATITLTAKSTSTRFTENTYKIVTFSIIAKSLTEATITLTPTEYTYDGNAKNPSVTIKFESEGGDGTSGATGSVTTLTEGTDYDVTYKKVVGESEESIAASEIITAGTYKAIATAKGNYTGTKEATFTIAKANITPRVAINGWAYGATANTPTISDNTGNGSVTYEYKLQNEADSKYKADVPTEAGDYTIKATIAATANYEAAVDSTHFTITKANITPRVAINGWAYGATANTPTISDNTGNGSVTYEYKLQNEADSKYKADVPTEAGDYTIKATIAATANYESAVDSTHFTISKAMPSITFDEENYSATYGEAFTAPTPTTSPEGLTVVVTNSSNTQVATITNGVISIIGVGETTITVSFAGNDNYNATTATYKITVGAASMEIVGTGYSGIYDGQAHGITVNAPQDAVIKYGTTEGTYNLETSPEYTDAGNYTVYYQVTRTNYQTVTGSKTVVIAKADVSITYNEDGYTTTYGEEFNPPTPTTNPTGLTLTPTSSSNTQVATVTDGRINITGVGETNITVSFAGNNNYNDTTVTYKLTVEAASMSVTAEGFSGVYDSEAHGITITAPEVATIKYGTTEGTYNLDASPEYTDAGNYTVYYQVTQENYQTVTGSKTVIISKADINPTIALEGWTYGATANTPEVNGNTGNGTETITYKAEGAEEFSSEVPSEVGTYIVKVTIAETTNYNGGEATSTFTITNRTIDPAEDIEFSDGQSYASFYSADEDLALPEEGIAVFMITGLDGNTLTTQAVTYIPKGVPVLVMKASGTTQAIDPSEVSNNMLHYATSDVTADGTTYILYNGEYVRATGTIPAGKCYLKLNKPSGARALAIGNGTTGIDRLDNTEWATDNWFDLNGRRIEKPTKKGFYIKNGKKVVVK